MRLSADVNLDFTLVDVFSDRPFGGNQLAVFPRAEGVSTVTMQHLAREFNFSETTFVLPPQNPSNTCRVRIFTPLRELPFAGHPTVGTAAALVSEYKASRGKRFIFEEGIGDVSVDIDERTFWLRLGEPRLETAAMAPDVSAVAAALSLPARDVLSCWYAGVGLRFCFVHLASAETVSRATLDRTAWMARVADGWAPDLYVFAGDLRDRSRLEARCFAPSVGVDEDPATGSAGAGLVASLAASFDTSDQRFSLHIEQGVEMGRPSRMQAVAVKQSGQLTEVSVGGQATILGTGTITVDEP